MQIFTKINSFKKTVIFIHGFGKKYNDFNVTEHNKNILIEHVISKTCNTIMLQFVEDDYKNTIAHISEKLMENLDESILKTKIIIVAHSYGCFNAIYLCETYPNIFGRILLIEPTIKSETYKKILADHAGTNINSVEYAKFLNYDLLPNGFNISDKVILIIHANIVNKEQIVENQCEYNDKITNLEKLLNNNIKSKLVQHINKSHMLHYKIPDIIIKSIKELCKL